METWQMVDLKQIPSALIDLMQYSAAISNPMTAEFQWTIKLMDDGIRNKLLMNVNQMNQGNISGNDDVCSCRILTAIVTRVK